MLFLPEGENHELGLLFANYLVRAAGHRALYLGQNLPLANLESIDSRFSPDFIFTSMTTGYSRAVAEGIVQELTVKFPKAQILLTGKYFLESDRDYPANISLVRTPEDLKRYF
jgi:methanogenic corrinoid protein MtbC1